MFSKVLWGVYGVGWVLAAIKSNIKLSNMFVLTSNLKFFWKLFNSEANCVPQLPLDAWKESFVSLWNESYVQFRPC